MWGGRGGGGTHSNLASAGGVPEAATRGGMWRGDTACGTKVAVYDVVPSKRAPLPLGPVCVTFGVGVRGLTAWGTNVEVYTVVASKRAPLPSGPAGATLGVGVRGPTACGLKSAM